MHNIWSQKIHWKDVHSYFYMRWVCHRLIVVIRFFKYCQFTWHWVKCKRFETKKMAKEWKELRRNQRKKNWDVVSIWEIFRASKISLKRMRVKLYFLLTHSLTPSLTLAIENWFSRSLHLSSLVQSRPPLPFPLVSHCK